ncbi:aminopeptidase P family protein [Helicobacter apodemus]|uniref:Aminopeptidase P family protein n=1 Tax=Helicobacter apodemus TaxID=135569 RepID=A0A4U8UE43_9HELI|nr:aminopeptidase P family protein [Helicobacter apodemus]MDE6958767.1 aminopeptidase P family protein [Helicobacter apodemus]TLE16026.1 aminopeptidase P family protein [Helicobacter apodemus]
MNIYATRIKALQQLMKNDSIDAYLILTSDPHLSEYIPDYWKSREWIGGFSGSAGSILITQDYAGLWTDGRYWLQAQKELQDTSLQLQKQDSHNTPIKWLKANLGEYSKLATDYRVLPLSMKKDLQSQLQDKKITLLNKDFLTLLWEKRPPLPLNPIYEHIQSPHNRIEKIQRLRQEMQDLKATYHCISTLDDIAWVCNLRGSDVSYNPVFLSYLIISKEEVILFVDKEKIPQEVLENLYKDGFTIKPYCQIESFLESIKNQKILIDSTKTTAALADILKQHNEIIESLNPSCRLKASKSEQELEQIQVAMIQDGIALCKFYMWLEDALEEGQRISELDIDEKLREFRLERENYISDSFATIAGFNANGAQPHYRATKEQFSFIQGDGLLLIDSGAQYTNGTTDITRVVPIGNITQAQKRDYTLVLKAHIALSCAIFPLGIAMPLLDSIARMALWREQLDYMHGTGHGVGYFLNVHEGPQVISYFSPPLEKTKAKVGMVSSIEPGIYRPNQWGVRLENLVVNKPVQQPKETQFGEFLCFETLTLCPFEKSCIEVALLNDEEKNWLNNYHKQVFQKLGDKLEGRAKEWLKQKTMAIN